MEAVRESIRPFANEQSYAAVLLARPTPTEPNRLHLGLAYRHRGAVSFVHLGWTNYLKEDWAFPSVWAVPDVDSEQLFALARLCRLVANRFQETKVFPYGLKWEGITFNNDGDPVVPPPMSGLTCATFVLAMFNAAKVPLVIEGDWPPRDEAVFQLIATAIQIEGKFFGGTAFALMNDYFAGARRIMPAEAIGACEASPPPSTFEVAEAGGRRAIAQLDEELASLRIED